MCDYGGIACLPLLSLAKHQHLKRKLHPKRKKHCQYQCTSPPNPSTPHVLHPKPTPTEWRYQ
jgi:hypothetical protein